MAMRAEAYKKVKQVLWIILFANLGVAVLKIMIGTIIRSSSMTADGFHSLTDGSSNIVGLIGIKIASKPVDEEHPYGHRKFETLAGLFISGMLIFVSGKIIVEAISRLVNSVMPNITLESLFVLLITLFINVFISVYEYKRGRELKSQILLSDSMHTRSDIYVSIGVLVTLICIKIGLPPIVDPIASLLVAGMIIHAAYEIFKDNSNVLVDKAVVNTDKIKDITLSFEQVKDTHNIRSRGSENDLHIDMHIMTEPDMSVDESHKLIHSIEEKMREEINENVQVIAHIEPFNGKKEA
ncbi:MAG: cation diffusion facilitator family transporter [Herbinix sp.]|nr:cation diffusion facilitator family transporter [Herbinix sp.]